MGCLSGFSRNPIYLQCYLFTIAYIMGPGILGVPVSLAKSGLLPFLLVFVVSLFMQIISVYHMTDVLQKSVAVQQTSYRNVKRRQSLDKAEDTTPLTAAHSDDDESEDFSSKVNSECIRQPDIHMIGEMFLPPVGAFFFDTTTLMYLLFYSISTGIAGSAAIAQLFHIRHVTAMIIFCWSLNVILLVGRRFLLPCISVLTIFKGSLLVITTLIAFVVGSEVERDIQTDFSYTAIPFMISSSIIGATQTSLPYLFAKIPFKDAEIRSFRLSIVLGLITCFILNILWAWAVLHVVPQYNMCPQIEDNSTVTQCLTHFNYTLLQANENGEIATIPFQQVIDESYPTFKWVALLAALFVTGSVTVAYLVYTNTAIHTVEGAVISLWPKDKWRCLNVGEYISTEGVIGNVLSFVIMSGIFVVVFYNPKGFIILLETAGPLLVNILAGIFVTWLFFNASASKYSKLEIPVPLSKAHKYFIYPAILYFIFATIFDIVLLALRASGRSL